VSHLAVAKTYKLFIGGAFPRSESGRTYQARDSDGHFWRMRHSVPVKIFVMRWLRPARDTRPGPRRRRTTAVQVIYRIAEMLEGPAD
jgi:hypothetical protein